MSWQFLPYYIGGLLIYLIVLAGGSFMFSLGYERKRRFFLRFLLSLAAVMLLSVPLAVLQYYIEWHFQDVIITNIAVFIIYTALFVLWLIGMMLSYREPFLRLLVAVTFGGLCQHIAYSVYAIINVAANLDTRLYLAFLQWGYAIGVVIQFVCALTVMLACWFLFAKKIALPPDNNKDAGLFVSLCLSRVILSVLNALSNIYASEDTAVNLFARSTLMICALCILVLYVMMLEARSARSELEIVTKLNFSEHEHFLKVKQEMDLVSIKCHDIKHFIAEAGARKGVDLSQLSEAVRIYDTTVKTGNEVVDTMLAERSLYCSAHGITLSVIADASALDFIGVTDMCALFGNLLENAVEAAEQVKEKNRRTIGVNIRPVAGQVFVCVENTYEEAPAPCGGLPATSKPDKAYHGYGLKSIRYVAEKYGGVFSYKAEGGIFRASVLFPVPGRAEV